MLTSRSSPALAKTWLGGWRGVTLFPDRYISLWPIYAGVKARVANLFNDAVRECRAAMRGETCFGSTSRISTFLRAYRTLSLSNVKLHRRSSLAGRAAKVAPGEKRKAAYQSFHFHDRAFLSPKEMILHPLRFRPCPPLMWAAEELKEPASSDIRRRKTVPTIRVNFKHRRQNI